MRRKHLCFLLPLPAYAIRCRDRLGGPAIETSFQLLPSRFQQIHLHFDHCGSLVRTSDSGRYALTFPRAEIALQRPEWEAALNPDTRSGPSYFPPEFWKTLEKSGKLRLLDGPTEITDGVFAHPLGGHTAGHQVVEVRDGGERAVYLGDFIPTAKHLRFPYITAFGLFPLITLEHKQRFLPEAVANGWVLVFEHDHEVAMATLHEANGQVTAQPIDT